MNPIRKYKIVRGEIRPHHEEILRAIAEILREKYGEVRYFLPIKGNTIEAMFDNNMDRLVTEDEILASAFSIHREDFSAEFWQTVTAKLYDDLCALRLVEVKLDLECYPILKQEEMASWGQSGYDGQIEEISLSGGVIEFQDLVMNKGQPTEKRAYLFVKYPATLYTEYDEGGEE